MQKTKEDLIALLNSVSRNTLMETLEIEVCDIGDDYLTAKMPVNNKVYQPDGILHGGATVALAESAGSFAAHVFVDLEKYFVRGIEISANHLKSVKDGYVYAKATFIHKGRTTQLLSIKITDEEDRLISVCKLTTIALPKPK